MTYLDVADLRVAFRRSGDGWAVANRGVNLQLSSGMRCAIIGESGSGKSVMIRTALGLLEPSPSTLIKAERLNLFGHDVNTLGPVERRRMRRKDMLFIPQENMTALDPLYTAEELVKSRMRLAIEARNRRDPWQARRSTEEAYRTLAAHGLSVTRSREIATVRASWTPVANYSGGMRQMTFLGQVMLVKPRMLIIDEGTTALDNMKERAFFDALMNDVWSQADGDMSLLFISHNIELARAYADHLYVMFAGVVVESGPAADILSAPRHPYTRLLMECQGLRSDRISIEANDAIQDNRLKCGSMREEILAHTFCPFASRCADGPRCREQGMPEETAISDSRRVRCHFPVFAPKTPATAAKRIPVSSAPVLLLAKGVSAVAEGKTINSSMALEIHERESVGLVGGSGHGKSTFVKAFIGLPGYRLAGGDVMLSGIRVRDIPVGRFRRTVQYVPQIVHDAFLEYFTVEEALLEPLFADKSSFKGRIPGHTSLVARVLDDVGLPRTLRGDTLSHLSGGQRQRVAIARALVALRLYSDENDATAKILILDEPTSSLDAPVRSGILSLLHALQDRLRLSYLFISHDLEIVRHFCSRILVVYWGTIVENVSSESINGAASVLHPFTWGLFGLSGEAHRDSMPDFSSVPAGCRYRHACRIARKQCADTLPYLRPVGPAHYCACFRGGMLRDGTAVE